jgi:hypothetical protein
MGMSGKNDYSRRIDYTADANYHVGSFGHGGTDIGNPDRIFHYGSGFFDVWSGAGTYAPGTTHIHGFNALHYTTGYGGNAYGWQMASQYNQTGLIYARWCSGGSFSAWQTIITSANIGSQSVSYASSAGSLSSMAISQFSNTLKLPSYYSNDLPYTCSSPAQQGNNLQQLIAGVTTDSLFEFQTTNPLNGLLVGGKYEQDYNNTQQILPSAPRTLTQSQIYTINEINKNRNNTTNHLSKAPTSADILAILPVKTSTGVPTGTLLVEFSGSLQDNSRVYFGPVDIDRMAVKLLDDKGNILNLNGSDWCITLICECLYQY